MVNVGGIGVLATTILERYVGFWAAYLLPFCIMWISVFTLVIARYQSSKQLELIASTRSMLTLCLS